MAKNLKKEAPIVAPNPKSAAKPKVEAPKEAWNLANYKLQSFILFVIGFVFYCNTLSHEYAFDDMMAIVNNDYVQQGVSGIPKIFTTDAYQSYQEHHGGSNQLAGGRYRPLSLVTFAIEQQVFGPNTDNDNGAVSNRTPQQETKLVQDMNSRHVVNVFLFIGSLLALLLFLRQVIFKDNPVLAFFATVLFAIHPLHTEVVANVKSRDEILSVLFISLTFVKAFQFRETGGRKYLIWAGVFYFFALLSKEYAVTLLLLLPISFYIFGKDSWQKSFKGLLPFLIPFGLYFLMRMSSVTAAAEGAEKDIMNYPYLLASPMQKLASEIAVLFRYLQLLFFPHPMVSDYSYKQIPYSDFGAPIVWVSLMVYLGIFVSAIVLIIKRNILGFALALYLVNLALVSNIFVNIGAPMGERLVYHSSIGFVIALAFGAYTLFSKAMPKASAEKALAGLCILLIPICGYATITRNADWKNNSTLFLTDVKTSPNSALTNTNAGAACMKIAKESKDKDAATSKMMLQKALDYFSKTLTVDSGHSLARVNRGLCFFNMGMPEKALQDWEKVRRMGGTDANLTKYLGIAGKYYMGLGMKYIKSNMSDSAIYAFSMATVALPTLGDTWLNLGSNYLSVKNYPEARKALEKAVPLMPGNNTAAGLLQSIPKE